MFRTRLIGVLASIGNRTFLQRQFEYIYIGSNSRRRANDMGYEIMEQEEADS